MTARACSDCGASITRQSKTGRCRSCHGRATAAQARAAIDPERRRAWSARGGRANTAAQNEARATGVTAAALRPRTEAQLDALADGRVKGVAASAARPPEARSASARLGYEAKTYEQRRELARHGEINAPAGGYRSGRVRLAGAIDRKRVLIALLEADLAALKGEAEA